jgi:hypothetical protein
VSLHSFDPEIARRVGVNAAVIYQNILFWTEKNYVNGKNCIDGCVWTYNSVRAWAELFPYLTQSQIRLALAKLVEDGLIVEGNHSDAAYDRTKWYGVFAEIHLRKNTNGFAENREPITDSKPDIKPDIKPTRAKRDDVAENLTTAISPDRADAVIAHRKALRKPLTAHAAKLLAAQFAQCHDPNAAADAMIANGWQGFKPEWLERQSQGRGHSPPARTNFIEAGKRIIEDMNRDTDTQGHSGYIGHAERLP